MKITKSRSKRIRVTRAERGALGALLRRGHTGLWIGARARAVLMASEGASLSEIARDLRRDRKWVRLWLLRFEKLRLAGLRDVARSGRPPKFSPRRAA